MKKPLAFTVFVILFGGISHAQFGLNIGYMPTTITTEYTGGPSSGPQELGMMGFGGNIYYNFRIYDEFYIAFGAGARYSMKSEENMGAKQESTVLTADVPILANGSLPFNEDWHLTLFSGFVVSYTLSAQTQIKIAGMSIKDDWLKDDYADDVVDPSQDIYDNPLAFGFMVGASFDYKHLHFFGGRNIGLFNFSKNDHYERHTGTWIFGIGLGF